MLTATETRTLIEFINKSFGLDLSENLKPIALSELSKFKKENKIISHIAVTFTLLILIALFFTRLEKSISDGGGSLVRIVAMLFTGTLAMISFIKSFIKARKKK